MTSSGVMSPSMSAVVPDTMTMSMALPVDGSSIFSFFQINFNSMMSYTAIHVNSLFPGSKV